MKYLIRINVLLIFLYLFQSRSGLANIRLPKLISDGMVLQRDAAIKIWGWAEEGEGITLKFQDQSYNTITDKNGKWEVELSELKAGGPFLLLLEGSNRIAIKDVLVGDVWVCSGQSNMELPMRRVRPRYEDEITKAENPFIRQFTVPQKYDFKTPLEDLDSGLWKAVTPENILDFSATAYFFAKYLYEIHRIPIGLINTSLGGSPVEAWMSEEALKKFPEIYNEAIRFKNDSLIRQIERADDKRIKNWYAEANVRDAGYQHHHWGKDNIDVSSWPAMAVPGYWAETNLGEVQGVVWFRREFTVNENMVGKKARLNLGAIVDADSVWINGTFIGATTYMYPPRWYEIPANTLKSGKNFISVRVINERGKGGFVPGKAYEIVLGKDTLDLSGTWKYKLGTTMPQLESQTFIRWKPLGLYNAMIYPLEKYSIKGVIWYQGESNVPRAKEYRALFPAMVNNWRKDWKQDDFPFLFVQLANFQKPQEQPSESDWAMLREAQAMCLSIPNTGMAVTIDIGEWNDIHPLNKAEVGRRLALAAEHVAYKNNKDIFSGPTYKTMIKEGNKIVLSFDHAGTGLMSKGSTLKSVSIAGEDKKFVWAKAKIEGNKVVVYSPEIRNPVAVRYAWADDPEGANLYNSEGLPAVPFRTDNW